MRADGQNFFHQELRNARLSETLLQPSRRRLDVLKIQTFETANDHAVHSHMLQVVLCQASGKGKLTQRAAEFRSTERGIRHASRHLSLFAFVRGASLDLPDGALEACGRLSAVRRTVILWRFTFVKGQKLGNSRSDVLTKVRILGCGPILLFNEFAIWLHSIARRHGKLDLVCRILHRKRRQYGALTIEGSQRSDHLGFW
mmetsp:Transcript_65054/g.172286  ORF Transcript_65054/g.172286 Transcript_65054/m.172286 type:complete len:200 (-) Transcript_65054:369-968(-)